jgi:hypothetical protein
MKLAGSPRLAIFNNDNSFDLALRLRPRPSNWLLACLHVPDRLVEGEATMISAAFPYQKQRQTIHGSEMAYVEVGKGDPSCFCPA